MKKELRASSSNFLSQKVWRHLRKIVGKKVWTNLYIISQKTKLPKKIEELSKSDLGLKRNLEYPAIKNNEKIINEGKKFSEYLKNYNTSKPGGIYREFLDRLFFTIRPKTKTILELGISEGGGLLSMRDFFEKSYLWGVDIDKDTFVDSERIVKCDWADQLKTKTLKKNAENFNTKFDLIVDDGWHHPESQINSLISYLPYLSQKGTYIVEDIVHYHYSKYFKKVVKILEDKGFEVNYKNFDIKESEISDNLGYLIVSRKQTN